MNIPDSEDPAINHFPRRINNKQTKIRRVFIGGLGTDNFTLPPEHTGLAFLNIGVSEDDSPYESITIGDNVIKSEKVNDRKNSSVQQMHIYNPNNIVVADFEWLKKNWSKIEKWYEEENYSHIEDCNFNF